MNPKVFTRPTTVKFNNKPGLIVGHIGSTPVFRANSPSADLHAGNLVFDTIIFFNSTCKEPDKPVWWYINSSRYWDDLELDLQTVSDYLNKELGENS